MEGKARITVKAIADFNEAIVLDPKSADAYCQRGRMWSKKREYDKAIADFDKSLRINPKDSSAYSERGFAWKNKGEYERAIADYKEALRVDPTDAWAYCGVAWIRATCGEERRSRRNDRGAEFAAKACKLTSWKDDDYLDTLAAAYAEAGQFDKAVEWQAKALVLAPSTDRAAFQARLDLYKAGKPYREPPKKK